MNALDRYKKTRSRILERKAKLDKGSINKSKYMQKMAAYGKHKKQRFTMDRRNFHLIKRGSPSLMRREDPTRKITNRERFADRKEHVRTQFNYTPRKEIKTKKKDRSFSSLVSSYKNFSKTRGKGHRNRYSFNK